MCFGADDPDGQLQGNSELRLQRFTALSRDASGKGYGRK
jgi:hypothetical protein